MSNLTYRQKTYAQLKKDELALETETENLLWSIGKSSRAESVAIKIQLKKNLLRLSAVRKELLALLGK